MQFTLAPRWETTKRTLTNGLNVIVCPVRRSPMACVNLWYDVGSQNERHGQRGYAHLFEHLMFEGSKHYPGDYFKHLQKYGAGVNGSTSSDRTNYYEDIPADILELALAMESDRMGHLVEALDNARLATQKGVVTNEYRQNYSNQPYGMVSRILAESFYPDGHPYSWTTIGIMEEVNAATRDQVVAFFERFYVPANASLCVAGDVDAEAVFDMAERYFGGFQSGMRAEVPLVADVKLAQSKRLEMIDNVSLERIYIVWPTVRQLTEDEPALALLGDILTSGRTSRLYQELVVKLQLAQDVSAGQSSRELAGQFSVVVTLRPGASAEQVRAIIERTLIDLAEAGPKPEELGRAIRRRWSSYLFSLEKVGGFGGLADRLNAFHVFTNDHDRLWTDSLRYRHVTPEQVTSVAARYISGKPSLELHVKPKSRTAVEPNRAEGVRIGPPKSYKISDPKEIRISDRVSVLTIPRPDWPVACGAIAAMSQTDRMGPIGSGLAQLHVASIMEGTSSRTAPELAEAIESLGSAISPSADWDGFNLFFQATSDGLMPTWELATELWRDASFPEVDWQRQRSRMITAQRSEVDRVESLAQRAFLLGLFGPGHRFGRPLGGIPEGLERLVHQDLVRVRQRLNRPEKLCIALSGDYDESAMMAKIQAFADSLEEPNLSDLSEAVISEQGLKNHGARLIVVDKPGAQQAIIRMGQVGLASVDQDRDALSLWNLALGGLFTSRLNHVLREQKGLTYGVRSGFDTRRGMPGSYLVASSVQHDRCAEAIEVVRHEVYSMIGEHPLTITEMADARRNRLESTAREDDTCSNVVRRVVDTWLAGEPLTEANDQTERFRQLTLDQVIETASRRLEPQNWLTVLVADWSKVKGDVEKLGFDQMEVRSPADLISE
ncbi:MAG: insulinase family protein [Planctomycetota bacterium]|nr:MAG: insulinase family protein [Planctomycetota bacterium]